MTELKTQKTDASVLDCLNSVEDERKRNDSFRLLKLMREVTGEEPAMWGSSIVGFAPRKRNLTLYIMAGFDEYDVLLARLGKHKTGKSCLYINRLDDVDIATLRELIARSVAHMRATLS